MTLPCTMLLCGSSHRRALTIRWSLEFLWCCYIGEVSRVRSRCCSALDLSLATPADSSLELENCFLYYRKHMNKHDMTKRCNLVLRFGLLLICNTCYLDSLFSYQFPDSTFCRHSWIEATLLLVPDTDLLEFQAPCYILTLAVALYFKACMKLSIRPFCGREYECMIN